MCDSISSLFEPKATGDMVFLPYTTSARDRDTMCSMGVFFCFVLPGHRSRDTTQVSSECIEVCHSIAIDLALCVETHRNVVGYEDAQLVSDKRQVQRESIILLHSTITAQMSR
jgi:hypothetical protein